MSTTYERYDFSSNGFVAWPELKPFGLADLDKNQPLAKGEIAMCDIGIFDIQRTMIHGLRSFQRRYADSNPHARVFSGNLRCLREVIAAETGVNLLVDVSLFPFSESEPDLPVNFYGKVMEIGVAGLVVKDSTPREVFEPYTEAVILRRVS